MKTVTAAAYIVIDNMPKDAKPIYDCTVDAKPLVFKPGDMFGEVVAGKKSKDKRKYTVPLYPITLKIFRQVGSLVECILERATYSRKKRRNAIPTDYWVGGAVLCLQENKIGLAFHNPKSEQIKKAAAGK